MKSDPNLANIPVVVMTTSTTKADIEAMYKLQASCFVTKPIDLAQFRKVVKEIHKFWFTVVELPG